MRYGLTGDYDWLISMSALHKKAIYKTHNIVNNVNRTAVHIYRTRNCKQRLPVAAEPAEWPHIPNFKVRWGDRGREGAGRKGSSLEKRESINWVKVLHSTQHKIDHFGDVQAIIIDQRRVSHFHFYENLVAANLGMRFALWQIRAATRNS